MIKLLQSYKVSSSVISIYCDDDGHIFFADSQKNLHRCIEGSYDTKSLKLCPSENTELHPYQKSSAFSHNGYLMYSTDTKGSCAAYIKISNLDFFVPKNDELQKSILFYGNDLAAEVVSFCGSSGEYTLSGGSDGRVHMYCPYNGQILMTIKPKPDYIASIVSDNDGNFISYSAFDKSLTILDIRHNKEILSTATKDIIEDSFFYNNAKNLYAIGRDGNSYIFDLKSDTISQKALFSHWPTCSIVDNSERFAIVGTRKEYLYVIKLADNSLFFTIKLDKRGISSLHIKDEKLYIGFESGWLYVVDIHEGIDKLTNALEVKDFRKAKRALDHNKFLYIHPISEQFNDAWEELLNSIIEHVSSGNDENVFHHAEAFLSDIKCKEQFESILGRQKEFKRFTTLVNEKKFFEAFGMLENYSCLLKSQSAKKLEQCYNKAFGEAKRMIAQDPIRNVDKAKVVLEPFSKIPSKKDAIYSLLKNYEIFSQADLYIREKRFKEYFLLTQKFDFLLSDDVYRKVCNLAEASIISIKNLVEKSLYNEALEGIRQLSVFLPYKEQLLEIVQDIKQRKMLVHLIENDDVNAVYEYVEKFNYLEYTNEYKTFDKKFDTVLSKTMSFIANADVKALKETLLPYMKISAFRPKIKESMRQATFNDIAITIKQGLVIEAEYKIQNYISEFRKDKEIEKLAKLNNIHLEP